MNKQWKKALGVSEEALSQSIKYSTIGVSLKTWQHWYGSRIKKLRAICSKYLLHTRR